MDKKYFIIVTYNFKKTMLDVREISHVTTSASKAVDTSTVYMKNGKEIEVKDDEFFSELNRLEEELKPIACVKSIENRLEDIAYGLGIYVDRIGFIKQQIDSKDYMNHDDLHELNHLGIPIKAEIMKLKGIDNEEFSYLLKAGHISSNNVNSAIIALTDKGGLFYRK